VYFNWRIDEGEGRLHFEPRYVMYRRSVFMCVAASLSLNESCRVGSIISAFSRGWKSKAVDEVIKTSDQHTSVGTIGILAIPNPSFYHVKLPKLPLCTIFT